MPEYKIHEQDKFLAEQKKRWDRKQKAGNTLKAKKQTMSGIMNTLNDVPTKVSVGGAVGPIGKTSVRPTKPQENPLHGGNGHAVQE